MIAAFIKANVRPGKKAKLIEFLKWDCQVARDEEPATLRFDVFEDDDDDSVIYFFEAYIDDAGFDAHRQGEPFKLFDGGLRDECIESLEPAMPGWSTAICTTAEWAEGNLMPMAASSI